MMDGQGAPANYWTGCKCHDACNEKFFVDHRREFPDVEHIIAARADEHLVPWKERAVAAGILRWCAGCEAKAEPHYHIVKQPVRAARA